LQFSNEPSPFSHNFLQSGCVTKAFRILRGLSGIVTILP